MTSFGKIDLALVDGKIVTLNHKDEIAEAVAVKDGQIAQVGTSEDVKAIVHKDTQVIDLGGKTVTPGFVESHCHPSMAGLMLLQPMPYPGAHPAMFFASRL